MSNIIKHFKTITAIPHCSAASKELFDYLVDFSSKQGYTVSTDANNNILATLGRPKLCLQSHYDMVCMGKAPKIETVEREGWLYADEASLGADNGIGIAMMMALMEEGGEGEFLFTSDEEIGLIGANALALDVHAPYMLNLDSEDEGEVYIGCAGGADIVAEITDARMPGSGACYEVSVRGLPGGHSGVDVDKNIPSAIKVLASYLHEEKVDQLATVIAGERRNAIAANAVAVVRSNRPLKGRGDVTVRRLDESPDVYRQGKAILDFLYAFQQGVRSRNDLLDIPQSSINLAMVNDAYDPQGITIEMSARAMSMDDLEELIRETVSQTDAAAFSVRVEDKYPAWKPEENDFTRLVGEKMKAVFGTSKTMAIHAGLECGVLSEKFPQMQFASIGPTIRYPHSTRECVDLVSVEKTYRVIREIVTSL